MVFEPYDDEGYMLLSLLHYFREGHLYTQTYSQYGPFYFYAQQTLFRLLHLPVTHDAGRLVTLIWWMISGLLAGRFVQKLTGNIVLAALGALSCIILGSVLAEEPGHPQQIILPLFMAAGCLSLANNSKSLNLRSFLLGAVGAALAFTKINVGVFYLAALAHAILCVTERGRLRTIGLSALMVYAVAGPPLLMHADLSTWAMGYCLVAIICGAAVFACGSWLKPESPLQRRLVLWPIAGTLAATALIVIATLFQGMPLRVLLRGVVLDPLHHPRVFFLPLQVSNFMLLATAFIVAYTAVVCHSSRRSYPSKEVLGFNQCVAGLAGLALLLHAPHTTLVLPLLPLGLVSVMGGSRPAHEVLTRVFITDLAATQYLQSYPVAGSQSAIASAPMLLWAFMCVWDGFAGFVAVFRRDLRWTSAIPRSALIAILGLLTAWPGVYHLAQTKFWSHYPFPASALHGSSWLHFPPKAENRFRFMADEVHANCNVLFTVPGMGSFNFWSGIPAPNGSNLTGWMNAFDPARQQEILKILQSNPRACVIYHPALVEVWRSSTDALGKSALGNYAVFQMPTVAARDGYEIKVSPDRREPWIQVLEAASN